MPPRDRAVARRSFGSAPRAVPGVAVLLAVVLAACGAGATDAVRRPTTAPSAAGSAGATTPATPAPTTPVTATPTPDPEPGPVTIAFAGDVHLEGPLRERLADPATALAPISPLLAGADLAVVNLESAVGTGGTPEPKRFRFQAPPSVFAALSSAGVDVVSMANNHAKDFGDDGLAQTLAAVADAESGDPPLSVVGVGADAAEAFAPAVREVRGTTVAVIGAHSADDPTADPTQEWAAAEGRPGVAVARELEPLVEAVRTAAATADAVVVFMHWGVQGETCPSDSQRGTAVALADAGAAAVVGSHTHTVQGAGRLGSTYVAYGLGNFVWYRPGPSGVLTLTLLGDRVVEDAWTPARTGSDGLPAPVDGAEAERMRAELAERRACAGLEPLG